jgi:uncharacterized membrane protein
MPDFGSNNFGLKDDMSGESSVDINAGKSLKLETRFREHEISSNAQKLTHQKKLFWVVLIGAGIMLALAILQAFLSMSILVTTQKALVIGMLISAPIILILALLRYVYDGSKKDDPEPSLMLNVGKELASVLSAIFKK